MNTKDLQKRGLQKRGLPLFFLVLTFVLCSAGIGIVAAAPVMSIIPSAQNVDVCDNFSVFIEVDPAGYTLEMALTNLTFDSSKVTILEVVDCGNFDVMFNSGTIVDGIIPNIMGLSTGL